MRNRTTAQRCGISCLLLALAFAAALVMPAFAWADGMFANGNAGSFTDGVGNTFKVDEIVEATGEVARDAYFAGGAVSVDQGKIGGSALVAGQNVAVKSTEVGQSLRAASQYLSIGSTTVAGNITATAQRLSVDDQTKAEGIYLSGSEIEFAGSAKALSISGQNVTINGAVEGDVNVDATRVTIGPNANITGTLNVDAASDPVVDSAAQIGQLNVKGAAQESLSEKAMDWLMSVMFSWLSLGLMVLLICWLAPQIPQDSIYMLQARPGQMLVTGILIVVLSIPVVLFIMVTLIGMLTGLTLAMLLTVAGSVGVPLLCVALGRRFVPRMSQVISGLFMALIAALLMQVSAIGVLLVLCATVYLSGYVLQRAFLSGRKYRELNRIQIEIEPMP